jgi:leucyl aminopeptidase
VKDIVLTAVTPGQASDHLIVLAEKDQLNLLSTTLTTEEMHFVRQSVEREVRQFFFVRTQGTIAVRLLKEDKEAYIALEDARLAGAEALKEVLQYKLTNVTIRDTAQPLRALAFAEGMALAAFQFLKYQENADKKVHPLRTISIETSDIVSVQRLDALVEAVYHARRIINEPFSYMNTARLAQEALAMGEQYGFKVEVLEKEKIEALKMGGLLSVNRASLQPPKFLVLEWIPVDPRNDQPLVLVGKGVVYDTGGYSIKPSEGMEYMKSDMGGAASVLGTFIVAAKNRIPVHLVGLIPITDNLVSATGIVPGDVIRMASGKTVEVANTDAEGRLILADALHYAKNYKPALVIDFATLTGAATRALGQQAICYMGTANEQTKQALELSGRRTYERLVEMPLWREYGDELKSSVADLRNVGGLMAGAITAGKFLEVFAEGYPWLHLDIAGPSFMKTPTGYRTKEGTGVGVRLMNDFLNSFF